MFSFATPVIVAFGMLKISYCFLLFRDNDLFTSNVSFSLFELRRDLQAKIADVTKTNINFGAVVENYGGETFLSQEVSINILQETKLAFKRCFLVSAKFIEALKKAVF